MVIQGIEPESVTYHPGQFVTHQPAPHLQAVTMLFPAKFTKTCPCFGASADATGLDWLPLLRNVLLLGLSIGCYLYYKRKCGDGLLCK